MAYVTVTQLKRTLKQLQGTLEEDVFLQELLDAAESIVDGYLGFSYGAYGAASTQTVLAQGNSILALPPHQPGSITLITTYSGGATVPSTLYVEDPNGNLYLQPGYPGAYTLQYGPRWGSYWGTERYIVTAIWGYGPVPDSVKQVVLELAKQMYFERDDKGQGDIVGVSGDGGVAVGYKGALTHRQKMILDQQKAAFSSGGLF